MQTNLRNFNVQEFCENIERNEAENACMNDGLVWVEKGEKKQWKSMRWPKFEHHDIKPTAVSESKILVSKKKLSILYY